MSEQLIWKNDGKIFTETPHRACYIMHRSTTGKYHAAGKVFDTLDAAKNWIDEFYGYAHLDKALDEMQAEAIIFGKAGGIEYKVVKTDPITPAQRRRLTSLCADILEHDGIGERWMGDYEYKQFEIKQHRNRLTVYTVVGRKGDEGTMGEVFCRVTRHFVIGPRGGIKTMTGTKSKCNNYRGFVIWGGRS